LTECASIVVHLAVHFHAAIPYLIPLAPQHECLNILDLESNLEEEPAHQADQSHDEDIPAVIPPSIRIQHPQPNKSQVHVEARQEECNGASSHEERGREDEYGGQRCQRLSTYDIIAPRLVRAEPVSYLWRVVQFSHFSLYDRCIIHRHEGEYQAENEEASRNPVGLTQIIQWQSRQCNWCNDSTLRNFSKNVLV
jgi:hypothetical protein